jgi:putative DNA primase/helicase
LIQRLQLAVWPDLPTSWTHVDRKPDQDARDKALNVFTRLDTIAALQFTLKRAEDEVPFLRFDEAAQGVFDAWRSGLEERIRHEEHPALEAHLAKYRSLVPSIALIHYLADTVVMTAVNEVAVTAGIAWADYLESHARRIYHSSANAAVVSAQALLKKIEAGKLESPFAARDAYRNSWQHLSKSETYDALKLLDAHGYVRPVQITTLGRPKTEWHVHPKWRKK